MMAPLDGLLVLDFSTLLPGPLATLMLAEAGAEIIKIERPGRGEDMRHAPPDWDGESLSFALLNRGKKSLSLDLKSPEALEVLKPLIEKADILVEQFRPGVMSRLGLGYEEVKQINPKIIYCSITGYGQTGPKALAAGHDLNYMGDSGVLATSTGPVDQPAVPPALIADVGGGTYPAVVNILLALRKRDQTGKGCYIDIAMADGAFAFSYWSFAKGAALGQTIHNGKDRLTGGSPRYHLYPASDGRTIAVGALEQKFWEAFCQAINLAEPLRDDARNPEKSIAAVAEILLSKPSTHWKPVLEKADCCCTIVANMDEVMDDAQYTERGVFNHSIKAAKGKSAPALPLPIIDKLRQSDSRVLPAPKLGEHNREFKLK